MPVEVVRGRTRLQPDRVFVLAPDVDLVVEKYDVGVASGNASTPPAEQPMTMRSRRDPRAGSTATRSSRDAATQG